MNKIILSFDYEIYFDGSNRLDALILNTNKILIRAKVSKSKLVFFIDIYYLIKLEENGLNVEFNKLKTQISEMILDGHEIQYHLHPHWFNAQYSNEKNFWKFDPNEYSLSDIIKIYGKSYAYDKFNQGINKMKEWFNYKPLAYRAGGLSIDQNQKELIEILIENKFEYDSSVMPGLYLHGKFIHIDHRSAPIKEMWSIENDFLLESKNIDSKIKEVPVMTINKDDIPFTDRLLTSIKYRLLSSLSAKDKTLVENIGKPFDLEINQSIYPISVTFDKSKLADVLLLKYFTKSYFKNERKIMCILSHPKSYLNQSFEVFTTYLNWVTKNSKNYIFCGFSDIKESEK